LRRRYVRVAGRSGPIPMEDAHVKRRSTSILSTAAAGVFVLLLPGCGGGGSTPHVNPKPTPSGSPPPSTACTSSVSIQDALRRNRSSLRHTSSVNPSTYTFNSNPSGLTVFINSAAVGQTSFSTTPQFSNQPYVGAITGPQASYSVCYSQGADGPHTIYYNTAADTNGKLASIGAAGVVRSAAARTHLGTAMLVRIPPRPHPASGAFDRLRIQVRYFAASIPAGERIAVEIERREGGTRGQTLGAPRAGTINRIVWIPRGESPQSFAARFRKHAAVFDARPLPLRYAQSSTPFLPNDTFYDPVNQWDLSGAGTTGLIGAPNGIAAPYAWGYTKGSRATQIAIIDTGADLTHADLASQPGLGPKVTYQVRWVAGEPPYPDRGGGAAQDADGHGTNVSGIAAADTDNGYGVAGTGFNVALQLYRIFPTPVPPNYTSNPGYGASTADEAQAIYDAINHHVRVINLSLGSCEGQGNPDPTEFDAVEAAIAAGVVVVAAAGNERSGQGGGGCQSANTIDFPAAYPGVVSVGATSLRDSGSQNPNTATEYVASYSNSGPGLGVVAPGGDPSSASDSDPLHWVTNLYSNTVADPNQRCSPPPPCLALFAGTSQATPHVSGVAALMVSANPLLGPAQVKRILESTADNINDPNQGHGRVNAYRALAAVLHDTTQLPPPTASNFVAIAYTVTPGSNKPNILNQTFTFGVPLRTDGTWRIADVGPSVPTFEIGLWYDANGNGIVDSGDYFGSAGPCSGTAPCSAASAIGATPVPPGFVLK
jgi:subtilisin family serine protease